jgi:hypothetical protein
LFQEKAKNNKNNHRPNVFKNGVCPSNENPFTKILKKKKEEKKERKLV